jgi:hypothetical protein
MRVLVCGGRYYANVGVVHHELIGFHWRIPITVIIHGGVSGAGAIAEAWARRNRVAIVRYPPNWECLGKGAEKLRNDFMLADSRPDFVIAFPGGRTLRIWWRKPQQADYRCCTRPRRIRQVTQDEWAFREMLRQPV